MPTLAESARMYWEKGFHVIPLKVRSKKPLVSWAQYQHEPPTEDEIAIWWEAEPKANIGIITGPNTVVVDTDSLEAMQWVWDNLPRSRHIVKTKQGWHLYYATLDVRNSVNVRGKVDIRGHGGYVVAPPSIHPLGGAYRFSHGGESFDPDEMATLTIDDIARVRAYNGEDVAGDIIFDIAQVHEPHDGSPVEEGGRNEAATSLAGQYIAQGHDLRSIKETLDSWNDTNPKPLSDTEINTTIASVARTHIRNNPLDSIPVELEEFKPNPTANQDVHDFPEKYLQVDGALGALTEHINASANYPQPVLALAAALPLLGSLYGRFYRSPTNLRTNIYTIGIGKSSCGKEHPMSCADTIFSESGIGERVGTGRMSSAQGLLKHIQREPSSLLLVDEFGLFLKSVTDRNAASYRKDIMMTFMELFGRASGTFRGMQYADTDGNRPRVDIHQPCVSLYGTSTPLHFYDALKTGHVVDGFLNRLLVFNVGNHMPPLSRTATIDIPQNLIEYCKAVIEYMPTQPVTNGCMDIAHYDVPISPDAQEYLYAYDERMRSLMSDSPEDIMGVMWGRAHEHAIKISLVRAIGRDYRDPLVSLDIAEWGCALVEYLVGQTIGEAREHVSDSDYERKLKVVAKYIPEAGISSRDLMRKTQSINRDERSKIIKDLIDAGRISQQRHKNSKARATTIFRKL